VGLVNTGKETTTMNLKETTRTFADGTRVIEHKDGVQRTMFVFRAGNDTDDADARISTSRWDESVSCRFADGETKYHVALKGSMSKDALFNMFRRIAAEREVA